MVSLRRCRLMGLCSGKSSFLTPLSRFFDNGNAPESSSQNAKSVSVHPMPSDSADHMHGENIAKVSCGSSNIPGSGSGSSKEHHNQPFQAAFMCGREPNFELLEEEKRELRKFKWDEFLSYTRHSITNKKYKRRLGVGPQKNLNLQ